MASNPPDGEYAALRRLGERGRALERQRGPDPYPRPTGPAPTLQELRRRSDAIKRLASLHGATTVRVFGSIACDDNGPGSELDLIVEMGDRRSLFKQAALQGELEELLGCRVDALTDTGLTYARDDVRERIEREAVSL
jgi:uncharacterized protein